MQRYPVADFPAAGIYLIGRTRPQADYGNSLIDDDIQGKVSLALIIRLAPAAHLLSALRYTEYEEHDSTCFYLSFNYHNCNSSITDLARFHSSLAGGVAVGVRVRRRCELEGMLGRPLITRANAMCVQQSVKP